MIPKTIHYCWFGRGEKPELVINCIESWKKFLPDYQIIEWNEDNFDVTQNQFAKEAYEKKKYAFVADYVRLCVLYEYGGIYLDSDVEVCRPLDPLLEYEAFSGFESEKCLQSGVLGCVKGHHLFQEFIHYYDGRHFVKEDGSCDMTPNTAIMTDMLLEKGLRADNSDQVIDGMILFPKEYFCPLEDGTGIMTKTENTYVIHWFTKSFWDKKELFRYRRARIFYKIFGKKITNGISSLLQYIRSSRK